MKPGARQAQRMDRFDAAYYDRYYRNPKTRVSSPQAFRRQGNFVCTYLRYVEIPIRRVVDLGCGVGRWQKIIHDHFPLASYTGVEVSEYLCDRYGWQPASVIDYAASRPFDLVICQDVVQYLTKKQAQKAIDNLEHLCRGALYFTCVTREDWQNNCDQERTDSNVHFRPTQWYRDQLNNGFVNAGGGLFLRRTSETVMFELECLP